MSTKEQFEKMEKLYHFTSFDTAIKIIESNRLRFGRLNYMNDIHEFEKNVFIDINKHPTNKFLSEVLDTLHEEIYKYRQISLTSDREEGDKEGFDLHQMWGLYADKGEGVCLVFDKKEMEKINESDTIYKGRVQYNKTKELESFLISSSICSVDVLSEIKGRIHELFFHKRIEWEHEQEFRLMKRCPNPIREEYLFFGQALKFIILSSKFFNIDEVRFFKDIMYIKEKVKKIEEVRAKGNTGKIPILIYGNGLLDFSLVSEENNEELWNSEEGYNILMYGKNYELAF